MEFTHITDYLRRNAESTPDKPAVIHESQTLTWSELYAKVIAAATVLSAQLGNSSQCVVAIMLANTPEFLVTYLGAIHAGHIAMPLDPNFKALEAQSVVERMKPALLITDDTYADLFNASHDHINVKELMNAVRTDTPGWLRVNAAEQVASMLFTSGTTGNPKAVPYTHKNHLWNIHAVSNLWQWTEADTILLSLPLSHWHGLVMGLDGALVHGNTIFLQTWFDAENTLNMLSSGRISLFMHVPIAYSKLIAHAPEKHYDLSQVRLCISGSSYLPPKLWQAFKDRFGHAILERYGANEMGLIASNLLDERQSGSVGYVLEGVEVRVQLDGEIAMRSPGLFPGYWHNEAATAAQRTDDGYWLSGDIGEIDDTGRLWLKGRVQEKMKKFGYTVYPRDVEWALMQHPKVKEVVVMSLQVPDELNDKFVYFVVGTIDETAIREFAKSELPFFWRPDRVVLLEEIPKTGRTSKPALKELRALVSAD